MSADRICQGSRAKASWVNLTHRRSLLIEIHCEAKTTQDFAADSVDLSYVFFVLCICENSLAVHWISLCVCVHVSP